MAGCDRAMLHTRSGTAGSFRALSAVAPVFEAAAPFVRELSVIAARGWDGAVRPGENLTATVAVTNRSGHKLPTGYPEGRRMWLTVKAISATDDVAAW